jgi:serine/threonine-protein kinase
MKTRFWSSDWFAGLLITIVVVIFSGAAPFQSLEQAFYDWGVRSTDRSPSEKIAVIAIDDESINNLANDFLSRTTNRSGYPLYQGTDRFFL